MRTPRNIKDWEADDLRPEDGEPEIPEQRDEIQFQIITVGLIGGCNKIVQIDYCLVIFFAPSSETQHVSTYEICKRTNGLLNKSDRR